MFTILFKATLGLTVGIILTGVTSSMEIIYGLQKLKFQISLLRSCPSRYDILMYSLMSSNELKFQWHQEVMLKKV